MRGQVLFRHGWVMVSSFSSVGEALIRGETALEDARSVRPLKSARPALRTGRW
jgi:hypothetical protein